MKENDLEYSLTESKKENKEEYSYFSLFVQGNQGGINFLLIIFYISVADFTAGNLPKSKLYVESIGIALVYQNIFSFIFFGINAALGVAAGRCEGLKDYKKFHKFVKRTAILVSVTFIGNYLYTLVVYFCLGRIHKNNTSLLYYTRAYLVLAIFEYLIVFYLDLYRQFFQARLFYYQCFVIEVAGSVMAVFFSILFTIFVKLDYYGVILAMLLTQIFNLVLYTIFWFYYSNWKSYWEALNSKKNVLRESLKNEKNDNKIKSKLFTTEPNAPNLDVVENSTLLIAKKNNLTKEATLQISEKKNKNSSKSADNLLDMKTYLIFCFKFALNFFLDGLWTQLDTILATFLYNDKSIAAINSFNGIVFYGAVIYAFGFSMILSTKISQLMVRKEHLEAKRVTIVFFIMGIILSFLVSLLLFFFKRKISNLMMNDEATAIEITRIFDLFVWIFPLSFTGEMVFATCRSIRRETQFFYVQIFSSYFLHFGFLAVGHYWLEFDFLNIWYAVIVTKLFLNAGGIYIILRTDWKAEADIINKEMSGIME